MSAVPSSGLGAVLTNYNEPLEVKELKVAPPEPGSLLVAVESATVCGSDVHLWEGLLAGVLPIQLPVVPGHEVVGRIVEFGHGADVDSVGTPLRIGDRVVWAHEGCRRCYNCTVVGDETLCSNRRVGMMSSCAEPPYVSGSFAEYNTVWPQSGRVRVPDAVSSDWASAASCALRTVVNAVERAGRIDFLDTVVIQGAGPLGLFATALVAVHSPRKLIVVGAPEERLALAREWGADVTVSVDEYPGRDERVAAIQAATDGRDADVVFELSGGQTAFGEAVDVAARSGRIVITGTVGGQPQPVTAHNITNHNLSVVASFGGMVDSYWKALEFMQAFRDRFDWDRMMGTHYGLDGATTALERMQRGLEIKPVIVPAGVG